MEYTFGMIFKKGQEHRVLKTIDSKHTELTGIFSVTKE